MTVLGQRNLEGALPHRPTIPNASSGFPPVYELDLSKVVTICKFFAIFAKNTRLWPKTWESKK